MSYRYSSSLGSRYCVPLYFLDLDRGLAHAERAKKLIGELPGQDTMQVEQLGVDGEWTPIWRASD